MKKGEIIIPDTYKYIAAFLTMRCNLSCSFCINSLGNEVKFNRNEFNEISGEEWVNALNKIESKQNLPITLGGGEPFLHKDFIYIINNLKPELNIDILTNLMWGKKGLEKFISDVDPNRVKRDSPYSSIRVSYHPEAMNDAVKLADNVKLLQDKGFSIGIWSVLYPSSTQLSSISDTMQFICKDKEIDFRTKSFTGVYKGEPYGDYSKFPKSTLQEKTKSCKCKTSELLIGPKGDTYRCHRDLYARENPIGNITDNSFSVEDDFMDCDKYGQCNPCDVKVTTNNKQELGHTSVEIKEIQST